MSESPLQLKQAVPGWLKANLRKSSELIKDGTHGTHVRVEEGVPLLSAKNISKSGNVQWDETDSMVSERDYQFIHSSYELKPKDVLLTVVGTIGRSALVPESEKFTIQRSVAVIRANVEILEPEYLCHLTKDDYFQNQLSLRANATAQAGVYLGELGDIELNVPPITEQQKIAKILTTVDNLIEKTEALIGKYQSIKQGMMHDLFTRGIDTNGQLRPSHHDGPHLYKQTELGWIPKEWEITNLGSVVLNHQAGIYKNRDLFGDGDNIVGVSDLYRVNAINGQKFRLVPLTEAEKVVYTLKEGDLVYGESSLVLEGIARTLWVTKKGEGAAFSWHTRKIVVDKNKIDSEHLCYLLNSARIRRKIMSVATQTALTGMTTKDFFSVPISIPSMDEQREIARRLNQSDQYIEKENIYLEKVHIIKKGLMQDLLTGKVRVKV